MIYILLAINVVLLVLGQTLWKLGLAGIALKLDFNCFLRLIANPYIIGGFVVYGFATFIWLYILSKAELSLVYPLQSFCYVAAAIVAFFVFKESIPLTRWTGISLIILGTYFVSMR